MTQGPSEQLPPCQRTSGPGPVISTVLGAAGGWVTAYVAGFIDLLALLLPNPGLCAVAAGAVLGFFGWRSSREPPKG
jgi:hypothetical protein